MRHSNAINRTRRTNAGFTLVELLTVVAIIVLLIGILVPAVNSVRTKARETTTRAAIQTLSTGMETFRADQMVGGTYAPSASDWAKRNGRLSYKVNMPKPAGVGGGGGGLQGFEDDITGAGLLVWALAGADLQGTAGFRTFNPNSTYWAEDTGNAPSDQYNAYSLDNNLQPMHQRAAPMVDLSRVELSQLNRNTGNYEIPKEVETRQAAGMKLPTREYPMFLDAFGGPILYWRADPAGVRAADRTPNDNTLASERGVYHWLDNGMLLSTKNLGGVPGGLDEEPIILRADRLNKPHKLVWDENGELVNPTVPPEADGFVRFIRNDAVAARIAPHKADSYIMVSAGADGIFGTADDVANFEHNGAELGEPN